MQRRDRVAALVKRGTADLGKRDVGRQRQHPHDLTARLIAVIGSVHPTVDRMQSVIALDSRAVGAAPHNVIGEMAVVGLGILIVQARLKLGDLPRDGPAGTLGSGPHQPERGPGTVARRGVARQVNAVQAGPGDVPADHPAGMDADDPAAGPRQRRGLHLDLLRHAADLHEADTVGAGAGSGLSSTVNATCGRTATLRNFADRSISIPAMSIVPSSAS